MMQQELCYQPNFGKVTALSISRRVVAVTIIRYYCTPASLHRLPQIHSIH